MFQESRYQMSWAGGCVRTFIANLNDDDVDFFVVSWMFLLCIFPNWVMSIIDCWNVQASKLFSFFFRFFWKSTAINDACIFPSKWLSNLYTFILIMTRKTATKKLKNHFVHFVYTNSKLFGCVIKIYNLFWAILFVLFSSFSHSFFFSFYFFFLVFK